MRFLTLFLVACGVAPTTEDLPMFGEDAAEVRTRCITPKDGEDWGWQKLGVVRGLAGDVIAPTLVERDGVLHLWFLKKAGSTQTLHHATSTDGGASFHNVAPVRGADGYPSVRKEDGHFVLTHGSGSFSASKSDDGVTFTEDKARVLTASYEQGRFDAWSVIYPQRMAYERTLFFSGFDGQRIRIGRAIENDDGSYTVTPKTPVIDLGEGFDNAATAQPFVRFHVDRYVMWYGGYDTSASNPGPYRVGFAESKDGITWTKRGAVIPLGEKGTDAWSTRDPAVIPFLGKALMFYVGMGDDGHYRLHRAGSHVCAVI